MLPTGTGVRQRPRGILQQPGRPGVPARQSGNSPGLLHDCCQSVPSHVPATLQPCQAGSQGWCYSSPVLVLAVVTITLFISLPFQLFCSDHHHHQYSKCVWCVITRMKGTSYPWLCSHLTFHHLLSLFIGFAFTIKNGTFYNVQYEYMKLTS